LDKEKSANGSYKQAGPSFRTNRAISNSEANSLDDEILEANCAAAGKSSPATSSLTSFAHHDEPLPAESKVSSSSSHQTLFSAIVFWLT
jgi:hypothetical protein